jgi:hypothetical protein
MQQCDVITKFFLHNICTTPGYPMPIEYMQRIEVSPPKIKNIFLDWDINIKRKKEPDSLQCIFK